MPRLGSSPASFQENAAMVTATTQGFNCSTPVRGSPCLLQKSSNAAEVSLVKCFDKESLGPYMPYFCTNCRVLASSGFLMLISTAKTLAAAKADSTSCGRGYMLLSPTWIEPTR